MAQSSTRSLPLALKAETFAQLALMEGAGLSAAETFKTLARSTEPGSQLLGGRARRVANALARGQSVAPAARSANMFSEPDAVLVEAASESGSPKRAYERLARRYARRAAQMKRIRRQCMMPALVLGLGLLVAPLPGLVQGTFGFWTYLGRIGISALYTSLVVMAVIWVVRAVRAQRDTELSRALGHVTLALPLFGGTNGRRNVLGFADEFAALLEAGLSADRASAWALRAVRNPVVADDFRALPDQLARGESWSDAIAPCQYVPAQAHQLIRTGEAAGRLDATIRHFCTAEAAEIEAFDDQVAAWVPRVFYAFVLVFLGASM